MKNTMFTDDLLPSRRNSLRLQGYNYAASGCYFITMVTQGRVCRFGDVRDGEILLTDAGKMVEDVYQQMIDAFDEMSDIAHVIMPNHVHLLLHNNGMENITEAVRWFKSKTTNDYIRGVKENGWSRFDIRLWQTRFYDVIIRNAQAHDYVVNYILNNPMRWSLDRLNVNVNISHADDIGKNLRIINW
jgi:REP element-mobilizing transposase RayT